MDGVLPVAAAGGPASLHQVAEELLQQQRAAVRCARLAWPAATHHTVHGERVFTLCGTNLLTRTRGDQDRP